MTKYQRRNKKRCYYVELVTPFYGFLHTQRELLVYFIYLILSLYQQWNLSNYKKKLTYLLQANVKRGFQRNFHGCYVCAITGINPIYENSVTKKVLFLSETY